MKKLIVLTVLVLLSSVSYAQRKKTVRQLTLVNDTCYMDSIVTRYTDSLTTLKHYYDSAWTYKSNDILRNPYYFRLFTTPMLYYSPLKEKMDNIWVGKYNKEIKHYSLLDYKDKILGLNTTMNNMFSDIYVESPQLIGQTENVLQQTEGIRQSEVNKTLKHEVQIAKQVEAAKAMAVVEPVTVVNHRPNFWTHSANMSIGYTQNYISNNWNGQRVGDRNSVLTFTGNLALNYNFNGQIIFQNSVNLQLGLQTVRSDTVHHIRMTMNRLFMKNLFGINAFKKKLYYSMSLQSTTPIVPQFQTNSHRVTTDFMSPYNGVLSVGLTYNRQNFPGKKKKDHVFFIGAEFNPVSLNLVYVDREALFRKPRHHNSQTIGSNFSITGGWNNIVKNVNWSYRLFYFSNFEMVQIEFENTFTLRINKYMNSTLYIYPRFNDTQRDEWGRYRMQLKEFLNVGFNYTFK